MEFARVPTRPAVSIYGSAWTIDEGSGAVLEQLGRGRSPFYFGPLFPSMEEASAFMGNDVATSVRELPETLLLPVGTPMVRQKVHLVRHDDLLSKGLRVDTWSVVAVDFSPPPLHMRGLADCVACAAVLDEPTGLRIRIAHEADGFPRLGTALRPEGRTWKELPEVAAYWDLDAALRAADDVASRLRRAAEWRDNTCRIGGTP